jgi:hypothetical protein
MASRFYSENLLLPASPPHECTSARKLLLYIKIQVSFCLKDQLLRKHLIQRNEALIVAGSVIVEKKLEAQMCW